MAAPESDTPRIRVAALLEIDGSIVLVKHQKAGTTYYLLPGGGVEPGERLTDALVREVLEETGLVCDVTDPLLLSDSLAPDGSRHMVQIVFRAEVVGGDITERPLDPRVESVALVEPSMLAELDLRPPLAADIVEALLTSTPLARYIAAPWVQHAKRGEA